AGAPWPVVELVHVDVALGVDLGERQARDIQTTAVVEVEHRGLLEHRLEVDARTAVGTSGRGAPEDALLHGERQVAGDALEGRDLPDQLADAVAEVADVTRA